MPPRLVAKWGALSCNARGILFILLSALVFSAMGGMIKYVGGELHTFQIVFFRCLFGLLTLVLFLRGQGWRVYQTRRPWLHALRVTVGISAMFALFHAVTHMDLAAAISITYARPLFMILLAILVLGEVVRWRRGLATLVGFLGVLVVMRPDPGSLDIDALAALASAALVAGAMTLVKILSATDRPLTILMWFATGAVIVSAGPALMVWRWPEPWTWVLAVLIGAAASLGQYLAVRAYREGEATLVTPFDYSQILWATLIGVLVFAEVPDTWTLVGAAIIIGSALYIMHREAQLGRPVPPHGGDVPGPDPDAGGPATR
ncbi:EamA family transporter [Roseospira visakhapatnamensis]|uniref:Drug/metabolite transporter (DMT)-like permease n=1 Tax=Roseospira visakhapatnamensis TaxID=390880 RepID=A0A7W6RF50_9PROT|nr:drug/metabolite transporter (DMT)-like permease [Roseospira visakhapatnamensis]